MIMMDTIREMGLSCLESSSNILEVTGEGLYRGTIIDCNKGTILFDNSSQKIIDQAKKTYTLKFYRDQAIKEGMNVELRQEGNDTLMYITHS
jgi:hypothetical protein